MKSYSVVIPPRVKAEIHEQILYIARDSIDNALAWEDRLEAAILSLRRLPGAHPIDPDVSGRAGYEIRKLVFEKTYLLFYRIDEAAAEVRILRFRHGARTPWLGAD
jgi:plasmid stabilization system protein ParE